MSSGSSLLFQGTPCPGQHEGTLSQTTGLRPGVARPKKTSRWFRFGREGGLEMLAIRQASGDRLRREKMGGVWGILVGWVGAHD